MKKSIFITLLTILMCQNSFGLKNEMKTPQDKENTVEQIFKDFSNEKNKTHIKIGGFGMAFARLFSDTKGVSGVEVLSLEETSKSVKDNFNDAIKNLKDSSYETLISTSEKGERVKVLVKTDDDFIKEIVVLVGGDDPALIKIKGKIKPEDVNSIVDSKK